MPGYAAFAKPRLESFRRKRSNVTTLRHAREKLGQVRQTGSLGNQIHKPRSNRGQPRPLINQSKRISRYRSKSSLPVMRQELRFVRGHVHIYRAVSLTAFACQAQIQRLFNMIVAPTANDVAVQHFP